MISSLTGTLTGGKAVWEKVGCGDGESRESGWLCVRRVHEI